MFSAQKKTQDTPGVLVWPVWTVALGPLAALAGAVSAVCNTWRVGCGGGRVEGRCGVLSVEACGGWRLLAVGRLNSRPQAELSSSCWCQDRQQLVSRFIIETVGSSRLIDQVKSHTIQGNTPWFI